MRTYSLFFILLSLAIASCGGGNKESKETTASDEINSIDDAANAMKKAMEGLNDGKAVEPVDHRKLKEMLKEKVHGFERAEYSSQSAGAMGFNIASAEANYSASGDKKITATIMDTGGAGLALMSMAAWSSLNLDREDQNGWERTGTWKGYKSFEKYDKTSNSSELALIVENRFIVTLNSTNCDMGDLKKFADDLDIDDLKKLI